MIGCGSGVETERRVVSIRPFSLEQFDYIAVAYDLDDNGIVDYFDLHLVTGTNGFGWFYLSPVLDTKYDLDQNEVPNGLEVN